jgi:sulfhydrogenase subunit beta (sulfur reductase)
MQRIEVADLNTLIQSLAHRGFTVIGPRVKDGAIVLDRLTSAAELPVGWRDEQEAGTYTLSKNGNSSVFEYVVGPHSWKRYLYPPRLRLFRAEKDGKGFEVTANGSEPPRYAFFGVRPCELHAIGIQDQVFADGPYRDHHYTAVRERTCIIAVNCVHPGGTCFCHSMHTGPRAHEGFDLALTEVRDESDHYFVVERGTALGGEIMAEVPHRPAEQSESARAHELLLGAERFMGRKLETDGLQRAFAQNFEHAHWDEIAKRCLACANCTLVCPTCFCSTVEDVTDLAGREAERWRRWDSCFTADFTRVAGGNIRMSTRTRYRQWITHKLANWIDQFGTSGCVGCGRCITWCPVGIDITVEAEAFRQLGAQQSFTEHREQH